MDAPHAARSGHRGTAMALAPLAHVLWTRIMRYDAAEPEWPDRDRFVLSAGHASRSEEHTSELQSLMRISYAVFCLKNNTSETPNFIGNRIDLYSILSTIHYTATTSSAHTSTNHTK